MEWLSLEVVCLLVVLKTHTSCVAAMLTAKAPKTVLINVGEGLGINKWIKTTGHTLTFLTKKLVKCEMCMWQQNNSNFLSVVDIWQKGGTWCTVTCTTLILLLL